MRSIGIVITAYLTCGCATLNHALLCQEGRKEFPRISKEVTELRFGKRAGTVPNDMDATGHIPSLAAIDQYGDCEQYAGYPQRYKELRDTWALLAAQTAARSAEKERAQKELGDFKTQNPDVERLKDWVIGPEHGPAYAWQLSQLTDSYAVFVNLEADFGFVIAVERSSINPAVALQPGHTLQNVTRCVRRLRDETRKNDRGFDLKVHVYNAVSC